MNPMLKLALAGAVLLAALSGAGCGRRGALDAPGTVEPAAGDGTGAPLAFKPHKPSKPERPTTPFILDPVV